MEEARQKFEESLPSDLGDLDLSLDDILDGNITADAIDKVFKPDVMRVMDVCDTPTLEIDDIHVHLRMF